jgi:hypothetical protein
MHMRQSRWFSRRCEREDWWAEVRLATTIHTGLSAMGMRLREWMVSLRNDSRRLTPGGAPMLNVCMYVTIACRIIQDAVMSSIRSSVPELCCLPILSYVS